MPCFWRLGIEERRASLATVLASRNGLPDQGRLVAATALRVPAPSAAAPDAGA
jgi:hypothetical protein